MTLRGSTRLVLAAVIAACAEASPPASPPPLPPDLSKVAGEAVVTSVREAVGAVQLRPMDAAAWGRLGHVYQVHGWHAEAAQAYRRAAELEPEDFRWPYYLARSLEESDPAAAVQALDQALDRGGEGYAPVHVVRANLLRLLERNEEAERSLEVLAEIEPRNPFTDLWRGEIALAEGRLDEARTHLEEAVRLHPGQSEAHRALAQVAMAGGDREAARRHAEAARRPTRYPPLHDPLWRVVEMAGVTARAHAARGNLYLKEGNYERAAAAFAKALEEGDESAMLRMHLGIALIGAKRYREAADALEQAAEIAEAAGPDIDPHRLAKIHVNRAVAYARLGEADAAEQALRRALELDPASIEAVANLALLFRNQGRLEAALEVVARAEEQSSDPRLARLLEQLRTERSDSAAKDRSQ